MLSFIRYLFLTVIGLALIIVALGNRSLVTLKLAPDALTAPFGLAGSVTLPLFIVVFLGIVTGLSIGFIWEWMREFKYRNCLNKRNKEVHRLKREVEVLKAKSGESQDDVLALLS